MHLKIADPSRYPFGMLSIYYQKFGHSIAEDAARLSVPKELTMTYPLYNDNTFFPILEENYMAAIQTYIMKRSVEAALFRARKMFMEDVVKLRDVEQTSSPTNYTQQLLMLAQEPFDKSSGKPVDVKELAFLIATLRHELKMGRPVENLPYRVLVSRYIAGKPILESPMKDIGKFHDLDTIVSTIIELDDMNPREFLIASVKKTLLNTYLDKILAEKYPHLDESQYEQAKEEQGLRVSSRKLEEKLFSMWLNGDLPKEAAGDLSEDELNILTNDEDKDAMETANPPDQQPPPGNLPRLALNYPHQFKFEGGTYTSPIEYGLGQALKLFSSDPAKPATFEEVLALGRAALKTNLRHYIFTLMSTYAQQPHIYTLLNYPTKIEWKGFAGIVGERWLTKMFIYLKESMGPPPGLAQKPSLSDLSQEPLLALWFVQRVRMWKKISINQPELFSILSEKYNRLDVRLPTHDEKTVMVGCDLDVWRVIIAEAEQKFTGTMIDAYTNIIKEVTDRLPIPPTFNNLCRIFQPIFDYNRYTYDSVRHMVSDILEDRNDPTLIILWTRLFL